ncbi:hypothetical protein MYXO_04003 [Myxococcaceae bacterium]|nr:hypothetical protein MYXO_04003 [Myxococcaceae bacterium]
MKADKLKALLLKCHDKTDLPTPAMLTAGADALADSYPYSDGLNDPETIRRIWFAMLNALRQDGIRRPVEQEEG